jgi:hypothetical protein
MASLSTSEIRTLKAAINPTRTDVVPRAELEKFLRLDLIEPCAQGMCMTLKGKTVLFG